MSTIYTINVTNNSPSTQSFFFFQSPALYTDASTVYSNSLFQSQLQSYNSSGSVLTFQIIQQYFAGAQTQIAPPTIGRVCGATTSSQQINLTPAPGSPTANATNLSVEPLGLSPAFAQPGVQPGAFRIVTPTYNPSLSGNFNIGLAIQNPNGSPATLSSFVEAQPAQYVDCQPTMVFYVQTGSYQAGTVINFSDAFTLAAACDTTTGHTTFNVTYNMDGTWTVQPR